MYLLQIKSQPYLTKELNEMERRSLIVSAITIYSALFFMTGNVT